MADDAAFFAAIEESRTLLLQMLDASRQLRGSDAGAVPAADSAAMLDLAQETKWASAAMNEPVHTLYTLAGFGLQAAEDNARAMCVLLEQRDWVPVYSHVVLARAVAENAGRVAWLVTAGSTRMRIARSINDQLYSLRYLSRLPEETHRTNPAQRMAEIREAAKRVGLTPCGDWFEEVRPSSGAVIRHVLGDDDLGNALYNYQSAVAHGTAFGLLASVDPESIVDAPLGHGPRVAQVTTASGVLGAFASVQLALLHAVEYHRTYFGWPPEGWTGSSWHDASLAAIRTTLERLSPGGSGSVR